jgi:tetratricopeptide (TPR) repeat protein
MRRLVAIALVALVISAEAFAQGAPAPTPSAPSTQTQRRPPQAKTQQEFKDYQAAYAVTGGVAMEKAATDFAAKYPQSELREYLFAKAMHEYQSENNAPKMLAMGNEVLKLDSDNSIALVLTATVMADSFSADDADLQQKAAEIKRRVDHALSTIDSAFNPPPNATPEQVAAYKNTLRFMAHAALGVLELKIGDDAGAEKDLTEANELNKTEPDPYSWYHLALAQDHQQKYAAALASVNEALKYISSNPDLERLAQGERDRLMKLTNQPPAPPPVAQPK